MMRSPFPGMDPYIEACNRWEDFHGKLISEMERVLAQAVPERYFVLVGERSYVVLSSRDQRQRDYLLQSDVAVTSASGDTNASPQASTSAVAVAPEMQLSPVTMHALVETEYRETYVEIRDFQEGQKLVTGIEVLSPSNKRTGTSGRRQYLRKRQVLLEGEANFVEIDLLRKGRRMPMADEWPDSPYYLLVSRREQAPECKVWPAYVTQPLPTIPIPLAPPDQDIPMSIQPLVDAVFARSRYSRLLDYRRPLPPSVTAAEWAWIEQRIRDWNVPSKG
jgi:hypothetical protein